MQNENRFVNRQHVTNAAKKEGVDIKTNCEITEETLKDANYDAIILATGGVPAHPPIPGLAESKIAMDCIDILDNTALPGNNVLVLPTKLRKQALQQHSSCNFMITYFLDIEERLVRSSFW